MPRRKPLMEAEHLITTMPTAATPSSEGAPTLPATLIVYCLIGNVPPGFEEGVRLNVYDLINFNTPSEGGVTLFVSTS